MEIHERQHEGIVILDLSGELRGGPADELVFKGSIERLIDQGKLMVLLNFAEVKWINSTGLGFVVAAYTELNKNGGVLKMCSPNERIMNIFVTTRFNLVIGIFDTEDEAITAFAA